jgi:CRP-like cAMP-binding protein
LLSLKRRNPAPAGRKESTIMGILGYFRHSSDVVAYRPGQTIFRQGERGDQMYVVLEGEVDLISGYRPFETAKTGALIGEMALIDQRPRSASAIARTSCKLAPVDTRRFSDMVQETPLFAVQVMKILTDRLRARDTRLAA